MKLKGSIKVVETIEQLIIRHVNCMRYKASLMDDIKTGVSCRQYVVDTEPTLAIVKLFFDYREDKGEVVIKDDKIWKIANVLPEIAKPMCELKPYFRHRWLSQDELLRMWEAKHSDEGEVVKDATKNS